MRKRILSFLSFVLALIGITIIPIQCKAAVYVIPEGTRYYSSSYAGGSGTWGLVGNQYTSRKGKIRIVGYSYLDSMGEILMADYDENEDSIDIPPAPENSSKLMLHFFIGKRQGGWFDRDALIEIENVYKK